MGFKGMNFIRINDRVINKDAITSVTFKETDEKFPDSMGCDGLLIATIWYDRDAWINYKVRLECFLQFGQHTDSYFLNHFINYVCNILNDDRISGLQDKIDFSKDLKNDAN